MIKKFFISLLGAIAGFWISFLLLIFIGICLIGAIVSGAGDMEFKVPEKSVLYLDLTGEIPETATKPDLYELVTEGLPTGNTLIDILDAIRLAKSDSKIKGIYIEAAGSEAGYATREEIVEALRDFKSSGKWIYAYGDAYTQGDFLVASVADSVFVNPVGSVDIHGVASQVPFFTGLLDKLGVKVNIVRVGTYKSAVEPFMAREMSPASREQTQVMIDTIWSYYTATVGHNRHVSAAKINLWADSIIGTWRAARLAESGAVSALRYRRNVEETLRRRLSLDDDEDISLVRPDEYMLSHKPFDINKPHIAVLFATGDIVDSGDGGIVGDVMTPQILDLADDDCVEALVLRVNSGGGSGFASEQIWDALEYFKSTGKPFYVSMGDYAASGGYYISCGADRIYADRTTLTGSIGVFGMVPNFSGLVTDKLGVTFSTVETNPNATFPSIMTPMTKTQEDALQRSVEDFYDLFTSRVADGRGMSQDDVKKIAEGRVWTGADALRLGLVDELGGLNEAIRAIAREAGLDPAHTVYYPEYEEDLLYTLIAESQRGNGGFASTPSILGADTRATLRMLDALARANRIQARMPALYFIR